MLGLVVYAHVFTEQEQESNLSIPIRTAELPSGLVISEPPPPSVRIHARGKGKQILKIRFEQPEMILNVSEVRPGRVQRMLSPADVVLPAGSDVRIMEILEPTMIEFSVDTLVEKNVPVQPILRGHPPEGFVLAGPVILTPEQVTVRGPSLLLEELDHVETERLDLGLFNRTRNVELRIEPMAPGIESEVTRIRARVPIAEHVTQTLPRVPVHITHLASGLFVRVEPDTAEVVLGGFADDLDRVPSESLVVTLDVTGLGSGRHLLSPEVRLPADNSVRLLSVRPSRFVVEIGSPGTKGG